MDLISRVKGILLNPKQEWQTISGETTTMAELYKSYIVILAAIGPVASIIGMSIIGISMPLAGSFRIPIGSSLTSAIIQYVLTLAGVYVLALVIDALAPTFSGEKNINQAFKVAAYSYTPGWLVGIFMVIPALGMLGILGLYGLYILYLGLPLLMKAPQEKSMGYTAAVIIVGIVIFAVIGVISHTFISYPMPRIQ
ncbi:MAG TPA: Yip1 family protein [Syntrophales bacterium]|nr:Yip1 family protein [Syntrophales bacterium]